jgi:hypothetical protein
MVSSTTVKKDLKSKRADMFDTGARLCLEMSWGTKVEVGCQGCCTRLALYKLLSKSRMGMLIESRQCQLLQCYLGVHHRQLI